MWCQCPGAGRAATGWPLGERPELLRAAHSHSQSGPMDPVMDAAEPVNKVGGASGRVGENTAHAVRSELKKMRSIPAITRVREGGREDGALGVGAEIPQQPVQETTVDQIRTLCSWGSLIWSRFILKD